MPCYSPITAYRSRHKTASGKRALVFNPNHGYKDLKVTVACGQCIGCRLDYSRQWAIRCMHEAQMHEDNCFLTLTYNDDHLPDDLSLDLSHFQRFMKRLRKRFGAGIRYFHCGEYGDELGRPHYHAAIFNFDFPDKKYHKKSGTGHNLYTSEALSELWHYGHAWIGSLTFESAAYVARYVMKKITGDDADNHYKGRRPEYVTMSRRPGIGQGWYDKFSDDIHRHDYIIVNGKKVSLPKYYNKLFEQIDGDSAFHAKSRRKWQASKHEADNTSERLRVKEQVKIAQIQSLKRS